MVNNQMGDVMPWPVFPPVSGTQPYTMRDGMSVLQILEKLKCGFMGIQDQWSDYQTQAEGWSGNVEQLWNNFTKQYATDFANLHDELVALIKAAGDTDNIVVWSPAYGSQVNIQRALDDIYDADRIHGLFVSDFDNLALSPAVFDAIGVSPRMFDLFSTNKINTLAHTITASDIVWMNGVPDPTPEIPDIDFLKQYFLVKNPTASDFSNNN